MRLRTIMVTAFVALALPLLFVAVELYMRIGSPPPMARGKHLSFGVPSGEWTAVLKNEFPVGTPDWAIVATLKGQGFKIIRSAADQPYPERSIAVYEWGGGFPCLFSLSVEWSVDQQGKLEDIGGNHTNACL